MIKEFDFGFIVGLLIGIVISFIVWIVKDYQNWKFKEWRK